MFSVDLGFFPSPLRRTRYFSPDFVSENVLGASLSIFPATVGSSGKATSFLSLESSFSSLSSALKVTSEMQRDRPTTARPIQALICIMILRFEKCLFRRTRLRLARLSLRKH